MGNILSSEYQNVKLFLKGNFPEWLKGTFVRNGPVNTYINGVSNAHWFDGLAKLHAFTFSEGEVFYSSAFLKSDAYETVVKDHSLRFTGFAVDPCRALFKSLFTHHLAPNANVNIQKIADDYAALTEIPLPIRFDLKTAKTLGPLAFNDDFPESRCWESAHPHVLEEETYNYIVDIGITSDYLITKRANNSRERKLVAKVSARHPAYMHTFSLTQNKILLSEYPFRLSPLPLMLHLRPFIYNYRWKQNEKAQFLVIDKETGRVDKIETDPFFSFHHVNAYEEGDEIVFDAIVYEDASIITGSFFYLNDKKISDPDKVKGHYRRYRIKGGSVSIEEVFEPSVEFPRINPLFDGKKHRYAYAANFIINPNNNLESLHAKGLIKYDLEKRSSLLWNEAGSYPGEPVFIPSPHASSEDDGIIVTIVLDEKSPYLLILDAKNFSELGRAQIDAPVEIGLHGQFYFT